MINNADLIRKKGQYQAKYGLEMDDFSITVYNEIEEQFALIEERLKESHDELVSASQKIEGQINQVHFDDKAQAFAYGLGKFLPVALALAMNGILALVMVQNSQPDNDFFDNAKITAKDGQHFISLKPAKNLVSAQIGKQYFYDKASQQVLIPVLRK